MQLFASALVAALVGVQPSSAAPEFKISVVPDRAYEVEHSDKRFHKDLKHDMRPEVTKWHTQYDFKGSFPHVQMEQDYDKDYVKDENHDQGEWKTQESYDHLRQHIVKVQAEFDRLQAIVAKDQKAYDEARAAEAKLEDSSQQKESALDQAKKAQASVQQIVDIAKAERDTAHSDVQEELEDLEMCREELEQAKDLLERELAEHDMEEDDLTERTDLPETENKYPDGTFEDPAAKAYEQVAIDDSKLKGAHTHYSNMRTEYDAMLKKFEKTQDELDDLANKIKMYRDGEDPFAAAKVVAHAKAEAGRAAPLLLPVAVAVLLLAH